MLAGMAVATVGAVEAADDRFERAKAVLGRQGGEVDQQIPGRVFLDVGRGHDQLARFGVAGAGDPYLLEEGFDLRSRDQDVDMVVRTMPEASGWRAMAVMALPTTTAGRSVMGGSEVTRRRPAASAGRCGGHRVSWCDESVGPGGPATATSGW